MNDELFPWIEEHLGVTITAWKLIGYAGVLMFTGRWLVQMYASRKAGRPVMNRYFWLMSMAGSLMLLAYFVFGKNDSVGVLSNLFPCAVASYNLYLDMRYHKLNGIKAEDAPPEQPQQEKKKKGRDQTPSTKELAGVEVAAGD